MIKISLIHSAYILAMGSGFRRYTSIDKTAGGEAANAAKNADYSPQRAKFLENHKLMIGYSLHGTGPDVAIFDYGYFGGDESFAGNGGRGGAAGGGYKIASDSKISAPSPFKGTG
jgi:hypothetical protein